MNELIGLFLFFTIVTALMHLFLMNASKGKPQEFVRAFTVTFAAKLFLYIGVLLVYRLVNKAGFLPFAFCFLCLYAFFIVFEVTALLRYFKK